MKPEGGGPNYGIQVSGGSFKAETVAAGDHARAVTVNRLPELRKIMELAADYADAVGSEGKRFDVFISHAAEDKWMARPLANALEGCGLTVWFDNLQLSVGDSLRTKIDAGVLQSRFGVVILSPHFFEKGWTRYELNGLVTLAVSGKQYLLPIWHGISKEEVMTHSPTLADMVAIDTSTQTIEEIAEQIAMVVQAERS